MAEPFGIAAGAVGIAAAFTACVDCFGYVQLGRHFGRDFQTDVLALNCTRLRLTRWGQAVNIYDDPKLGRPDATPAEIQAAKDTLHHILQLFADTEKISKKYKLSAKPGDDLSTLSTDDMDPAVMALSNKMKKLAIRPQKGSSVLKTASWALYHRSELKELIQNITSLIDNIEDLFPAPQSQLGLVKQETAEIQDKQALGLVESAAQDVDNLLQAAAKEALTGHQYLNVVIKGKAQTGDVFSSDWKGEARGASHKYDGVEVDKDGKALIGNQYGGKAFWDD
jgi:Prion-inhibition and propagation